MNIVTTVIVSILTFGFLIFIHEFGHYIFARIFGVKIMEFSIGMGPKLLWYDSKKTGIRYSLAMFPIGGYVAMAGEYGNDPNVNLNEENEFEPPYVAMADASDDPNAFHKKPAWQRLIVTVAGAAINIIAGVLVFFLLATMIPIGSTRIHSFVPVEGSSVSSEQSGLRPEDVILRVNGKRVHIVDELAYEIMRKGHEPIDLVVLRDGEEIPLEDVVFPSATEQEQVFGSMDFKVYREEKTFGSVLSYTFSKSVLIVRMCWESIFDLITGRYTFAAVSGPVGISSALGDAAAAGVAQLLSLVGLISINLGVMNLLPLPALDGGRMITTLFEMITRKKIPLKIEAAINSVGLALLLGLSIVVLFKDCFQIIGIL